MTALEFGLTIGALGTIVLIYAVRIVLDSIAIIAEWRNERKIKASADVTISHVVQCKKCEKITAHYALHGSLPALPVTGQKVVDGKRTTYHLIDTKKIKPAAVNLKELERLTGYNPAKERVANPNNSKR